MFIILYRFLWIGFSFFLSIKDNSINNIWKMTVVYKLPKGISDVELTDEKVRNIMRIDIILTIEIFMLNFIS